MASFFEKLILVSTISARTSPAQDTGLSKAFLISVFNTYITIKNKIMNTTTMTTGKTLFGKMVNIIKRIVLFVGTIKDLYGVGNFRDLFVSI